jgi:hypothetical protein
MGRCRFGHASFGVLIECAMTRALRVLATKRPPVPEGHPLAASLPGGLSRLPRPQPWVRGSAAMLAGRLAVTNMTDKTD